MNEIKKLVVLVVMAVTVFLVNESPALAGNNSGRNDAQMVQMFYGDQRVAIDSGVYLWGQGAGRQDLALSIKKLLLAESGLLAYGVDFNSSSLYGRLASQIKSAEVEQFFAKVFAERMKSYGYSVLGAKSTFTGQRFKLMRHGSDDSQRVNF